jgi:hypothetical protein
VDDEGAIGAAAFDGDLGDDGVLGLGDHLTTEDTEGTEGVD